MAHAALAAGPQLVSSTPAQGQDAVLPASSIKLVFDQPMDLNSLSYSGALTLYDLTNGYHSAIAANVTLSTDGLTATFKPYPYSVLFQAGVAYRLDLNASVIKDSAGDLLAPAAPILFNTFLHPSKTGPGITGTVPANNETGVAVNTGIYVVFDEPLAVGLDYTAGITLSSPSGPLKFTSTIANDRILQITTPLLLPANQQISVTVLSVLDRNGNSMAAPLTFSFQTGVLPDGRTQATAFIPPPYTPTSLPVSVAFTKTLDGPFVAAGSAVFYSLYDYSIGDAYPGTLAIAGDQRTLVVNAPSLPLGHYSLVLSIPFDRTQGKLNQFSFPVTIEAPADSTSAQLLAGSPPDGSTDVPLTSPIRLIFSKPVNLAASRNAVSLATAAGPVAADVSIDNTGTLVTSKPQAALQPSTTYTITVSGLADFAGNSVADYSASFTTTSSAPDAGPFAVTGISPADQSTGVDPLSPIQVTFSHLLDPVSVFLGYAILVNDSHGTVIGDYTVNGQVITFQPRAPMANGVVGVSVFSAADLGGALPAAFHSSFFVSNLQVDTTPPTVTEVSPSDGATVLFSAAHIELTFSKPISPGTLTAFSPSPGLGGSPGNIAAFVDGNTAIAVRTVLQSAIRVALEFTAPPGVSVTLIASDGIQDLSGNGLVPFRATFLTTARPANGAARLVRSFPQDQSMGSWPVTPADSTIIPLTTLWSAPLDRSSVEQNLLVYTSSGPVAGTIQWTADSAAFSFLPTSPYSDGDTVYASLLPPAHDAAGLPITLHMSFRLGYHNTGPAPGTLAIAGSNFPFPASIPTNYKIEILFNQDLPDSALPTVTALIGTSPTAQTPCPFARVSPRVLVFTPPFALAAGGGYYFNLTVGSSLTWKAFFTVSSAAASPNPSVAFAGPVGNNVAQNTGIGVLFSEPVSQLAMPGGVKLQAGGAEVPMTYYWNNPQSLWLQPLTFLAPNTTYTVTIGGFENYATVRIPDRTWTFQTGSAVDVTPPSLLSIQPSGPGIGQDVIVSFAFDKPLSPATDASRFILYNGPNSYVTTPTLLTFSDDLKTIFLRPVSLLAAGATYQATAGQAQDFAGNTSNFSVGTPPSATFQVGYTPPAPSAVTGSSPPDGATSVPVNAVIQVRSSGNLNLVSGLGATLAENGNPLNAAPRIGADGVTLNVVPSRPFASNSRIDVTVTGVGGSPFSFSFFTGADADETPPIATAFPPDRTFPVPPSVAPQITFDEALNPLSVTTGSVTLQASNNALIDATVSLGAGGRIISLTPKLPLATSVSYSVKWSISDLAGNKTSGGATFTVDPQNNAPAALIGIDPADGATHVGANPIVQAYFSAPVEFAAAGGSFGLLLNGNPVPGQVSVQSTGISFKPSQGLQPGATYTVQLHGVVDAFGNTLPDAASTFTVIAAGTMLDPLKLISTVPANGSVGVPADSPIRLTFSRPVTLSSALSLISGYYSIARFETVRVDGNDVVIQPVIPFTGSTVSINGNVRDYAGYYVSVYLSFGLAPIQDATPPVLESTFPAAGSTIPTTGAQLYLRFSKPVMVGQNAIRVIGGTVGNWYLAEDGRTVVGDSLSFTPDTDITIGVTAAVTDFAGNSIVPVSYQLHSLTAVQSDLPKVGSVIPPAGAANVPVDSAIQLQFTHAMDPGSVSAGLHVTADGIVIAGNLTSSDGIGFQFQPTAPFNKGAVVAISVGTPAEDVTGQEVALFNSLFTVINDSAKTTPSVNALFASPAAIDLRFDTPLDRYLPAPYIYSGFDLIPSHWYPVSSYSLRIAPDQPLDPGRLYRLALDPHTDYPLRIAADRSFALLEDSDFDGRMLRIHFDRRVDAQSVEVTALDGTPIRCFIDRSTDGRTLRITLASPQPNVILTTPVQTSRFQK